MGLLLPVKFLWFPVKSEEENRQMPESTKQHKLGTTSEASPGSKAVVPSFACFRVTWKACLHIGAAVQHQRF